jgi:hypothetical protein
VSIIKNMQAATPGFSEHIIIGRVGHVEPGFKSAGQYMVNFSADVTPWLRRFGGGHTTRYECVIWGYRAKIFEELGFKKGDPIMLRLEDLKVMSKINAQGQPFAVLKAHVDKFLDLRFKSEFSPAAAAETGGQKELEVIRLKDKSGQKPGSGQKGGPGQPPAGGFQDSSRSPSSPAKPSLGRPVPWDTDDDDPFGPQSSFRSTDDRLNRTSAVEDLRFRPSKDPRRGQWDFMDEVPRGAFPSGGGLAGVYDGWVFDGEPDDPYWEESQNVDPEELGDREGQQELKGPSEPPGRDDRQAPEGAAVTPSKYRPKVLAAGRGSTLAAPEARSGRNSSVPSAGLAAPQAPSASAAKARKPGSQEPHLDRDARKNLTWGSPENPIAGPCHPAKGSQRAKAELDLEAKTAEEISATSAEVPEGPVRRPGLR